jgi:hypothetical protein
MIVPPLYFSTRGSEYPSDTPFSSINPYCGGDLSQFGQIKNIAIAPALYAWITSAGALSELSLGATSTNFVTRVKDRIKPLINSVTREFAYSGRMTSTFPVAVFRNILNPVFTPGAPVLQDSETGGYQMLVGHNPSTLTFRVPITHSVLNDPGAFPNPRMIKLNQTATPGMYGVFLQNSAGDVLLVGVNCTNNSNGALADVVPIPMVNIVSQPANLGSFTEPGYTEITIHLTPNWDNPYPLGKCLRVNSASRYPSIWSRGSGLYVVTNTFIRSI